MSKKRLPAAVPARPYRPERLRDAATAAAYLNAATKNDDPAAFLQALRNVTEAMGGISKIAERSGLNRQRLYRTLSGDGNPGLRSLTRILGATGIRLQFVARGPKRRTAAAPRTVKRKAA